MRLLKKTLSMITTATLVFSSGMIPMQSFSTVLGSSVVQAAQIEQTYHSNLNDAGTWIQSQAPATAAITAEAGKLTINEPTNNGSYKNFIIDSNSPAVADGDYTATLTTKSGAANRYGIVVRYIDANNWVYLGNEPGVGWFMNWKSNGTEDWYGYFGAAYPIATGSPAVGVPLKLNINYSGKDFVVSINDTQVLDSEATPAFVAKSSTIPTAAGKEGVLSFKWTHNFEVSSSTLNYMEESATEPQLLTYTNDFESGTEANLADNGAVKTDTAISGAASYSGMDGKFLAAQQTGNNVFYFSDMPDIANGTVEMKFGIDGGAAEQFCPAVRVKDATHYSLVCRDPNGWIWDGFNGSGEVWGTSLNKAETLVPGKIYTLKETFNGDTYEIYLDGRMIYSSTTGNKLPTAAGKIGFRSYYGAKSLNIDSVKVTDTNNTVVYDRNFDNETAPVANIGTVTTNSTYSLKTPLPGFTGRLAKVVTTNGASQVVDSKSPMISDGTYSAKLQLGSTYTNAGLLFRYQDESNWSAVRTDSEGNWKLVGMNDGTDVSYDLTTTPEPLGTTPHQVQIDYHGDHYALSVDGTELYAGTHPGLFSSYGRVGISTNALALTTLLDEMKVDYDQTDVYTPLKPTTYIRDYTDGVTGTWKNNGDGSAYTPAPSITNNKLVFNNFFGEIYDYDSLEVQDGTYTVKLTTSSATGRIGFYFRYTSPNQPYAMIYYNGSKEWGWQTDSGHYGVLTTNGPTLLADTEYTVKIKYIGQSVKVFVNDVLAVSGSADFPVVEGKVGLRSWFDAKKITVSKLSQEKYAPPVPPTPGALTPITIASSKLSVELDNRFPAVRSYTWVGDEVTDTLQGQSDFLYKVKINGNESFATVVSATKTAGDTVVYKLNVPVIDDNTEAVIGNVDMDVTFKVTNGSVLMNTHINAEPEGYKVVTMEFPDQKLVTVSSANPNAQGASVWITGEWNQFYEEYYTNDAAFGEKLADQEADSKSRTYGFVSDGKLAATIINNVINQPGKVIMNIAAQNGTSNKLLSMWNGQWNVRGDVIDDAKFPPNYDLSSEIIITPDRNSDSTADWKDAAIEYRDKWSQNLHPGADEINNYVSYIAMNFNSLTQAPFLRTLDNAKKLYNLYDGFGQLILEKGYQAEGHDDSHPDVAGHFGIRPGGLKDFNTLVDEGLKYNVKVGVHTNIDGQDPDAYYADKDKWTSSGSAYDWVDPTYGPDRAQDLSTGELERRYAQLKQEVPNLAMVYDDVYSGAGWHADQFANIIQNKLGFWFATEFSGPMEQNVIWTHWGTDPYYPSKTDGSMIVRFMKNQYQDTFQAPSPATSVLLRGMLQAGVGSWQGRTDMQNGIDLFYNNNLLTKYMQHFPIMNLTYDSTGMDQSVVFSNGVTTALDEYHASPSNANLILGTASLKKDGKKIAIYDVVLNKGAGDTGIGQLDVQNQKSQLFLPWDPQNESKIYYWNPKGGSTTWDMPNSWNGLSSVEMYKLTDTGRVWERTLSVVDGKVTIDNTTVGVPYVIYKSKADEQGSAIQKAAEWGVGGPVKDPGFDSGTFTSWQKASTTNGAASHVTVEHDYNMNNYVRISGADDAALSQSVTGLTPGKTYTASVWADINNGSGGNKDDQTASTSNRNVSLQVSNYGGPAVSNAIDASTIQNLEEPSKFKGTYFQRLEVDFTADQSGQATLTLKADAATAATSNVWFDDVRLWENPGKTDFGSHYFYEDFENVSEGLGPFAFRANSGNQTHLAEKASDELKAADPNVKQPMTYVIDGLFSLKSNEQDLINRTTSVQEIAATLPSTLKLKANTTYKVGLKYEANKAGLYQISAKSRSGGPKQSVLLSEATGTGKSNIPDWTFPIIKSTGTANAELTFNTGDYSDYYIAFEVVRAPGAPTLSAIDVVVVLDDFFVDDLDAASANHAPVIGTIAPISVQAGETVSFTVPATDEDGDDLAFSSSNLPAGATLDAETGEFQWANATTGDYVVTVQATDGTATVTRDVAIHVGDEVVPPVNHAPVIANIAAIHVNAGQAVSFTATATDEDEDVLTYSAADLPAGSSMDASTGAFAWSSAAAGNYVITVTATDGELSSSTEVTIEVTTGNVDPTPPTPPTPTPPTTIVTEGHVELKATPDASGQAAVKVTGAELLQAGEGKTKSVTLTAAVDAAKPITGIVFQLPAQQVNQLADDKKSLVLDAGLAKVSFDAGMWNAIIGDSGKEVQLSVKQVDGATLNEQTRAQIGDHIVYDFTLTVDGTKVSQFKK
ncbi:endo-alpha-N-acetylgalactosaminidase family protein, partial [Paenibacillus lignilyticus]|nr:putative Ig domain-containing protein [Paenibacillus lignilyticus]